MSTSNPGTTSKLRRNTCSNSYGPDLRIFVKDVADSQGKKRPLTVKTWSTIKDVKDVLQQHLHVPPNSQRLYYGPLMTSGGELPNHRTLHDAGIVRSGETLLLDIKRRHEASSSVSSSSASSALASISSLNTKGTNDVCVSSSFLDVTPRPLRRKVCQARRGFAVGLKPDLVLDGSGGTYFLHDARKVRVGVFKPADEEPYAANNPRGYVAQADSGYGFGVGCGNEDGMRAGICPGEACVREVAAFLLDHHGFSGVPPTTLAEARHPAFNSNGARLKLSEGGAAVGSHSLSLSPLTPGAGLTSATTVPIGASPSLLPSSSSSVLEKKVGSFQEFVNADYTMDDLSPSKLSIDEVHKIAILDIRIMNADRNSANLLCRRRPEDPDNFELIPIDHGYCLRTVCDVCWFDWCWLDWPQLKEPLSKKSRDYVLGLDIEADVRLLGERLNLRGEAIDYFRASSKLLQSGVKAGLTLYDIAVMCCRNDDAGEIPSRMEVLTSMATELGTSAVANGRWHHAAASHAIAEQLATDEVPLLGRSSAKVLSAMFKSASSANFSSFISEDNNENSSSPRNDAAPAMAQSSGSDSSSDTGDAPLEREEEECEEWAAAVIADVSIDKEASLIRYGRSPSIGSETDSSNCSADDSSSNMLSSSPVGFWHVRPGSDSPDQDGGDDGSSGGDVTWSPHISPRTSILGVSLSSLPSGISPEKLLPPLTKEDNTRRTSAVTFELSPVILSAKDFASAAAPPLPLEQGNSSPYGKVPCKGISRSQSYSAFSTRSSGSSTTLTRSLRQTSSSIEDDDQHHVYFLKFIDLLVVRETTAAVYRREKKSAPKTSSSPAISIKKGGAHLSKETAQEANFVTA